MTRLTLDFDGAMADVDVRSVVIAGWTGRDRAAVEAHISELEALGVPRPSSAPVLYRVSASRLTTSEEIESPAASSGEAEVVLLRHDGRLWVGVGSDHTDREVETYGVALSKQLCDKPIGRRFWAYADVVDHWDRLLVRAWIDGETVYQEGTLDALLHPRELLELEPLRDGSAMFCGTFPTLGGVRPAGSFRAVLEDPVRGRRLEVEYRMRVLPLVS